MSTHRRDSLSRILENKQSASRVWLRNLISTLLICAAGSFGWFIAWKSRVWTPTPEGEGVVDLKMDLGPQILGYLSAVLYLGLVLSHL